MTSPTCPQTAPDADRLSPPLALLLVLAVYSIPVMATVRFVGDADVWWHLAAGRWIVEHGAVPTTDPLSAYGQGRDWVAYSWLYEVLVYGLYETFGLLGVVVYRAAFGLAVVAVLHWLISSREPRFLAATGLTAACAYALTPLMTERPWLISILFATFTLKIILDLRDGRRPWYVWTLPLVYVLWANCHIQFVYGFALLALGCAAPAMDRVVASVRREGPPCVHTPHWRFLVGLSLACAAATLVNPYGLGLYSVVAEYATQTVALELVREMMAMDFRHPWEWAALGLALLSAFRLGQQRRLSSFDVLLLAGSAYCCFRSRRDVWMVVLAAAAIVPGIGATALSLNRGFRWTGRRVASAAGGVAALAVLFGAAQGLTPDHLAEVEGEIYPRQATELLRQGGVHGPLFNSYDWGGYLAWRLSAPVSIDGRANLHGGERLRRSWATWSAAPGWEDDPDLKSAAVVVAKNSAALTDRLRHDPLFGVAHADGVATVFVRRTGPSGTLRPPGLARGSASD